MLTLFVQGMKGLQVLKNYPKKYYNIIKEVRVGTDKKVVNDYSTEIQFFCRKNSIPFTVSNTSNHFDSNHAIAIGWQRLITYSDNQFLIVFHDSILPRLRGFNPLVTGLINGDKKLGVTALFASEEYDKGDIIDCKVIEINYPIKIERAILEISNCYSALANKLVGLIAKKEVIIGKKQNEKLATYSLWRDYDDYFIDWSRDAPYISRFIDAVGFPYNGAKTYMGKELITILEAEALPNVRIENRTVGKLIFKVDDAPVIVCQEGLLKIKKAIDQSGNIVDFIKKFRIRFS